MKNSIVEFFRFLRILKNIFTCNDDDSASMWYEEQYKKSEKYLAHRRRLRLSGIDLKPLEPGWRDRFYLNCPY